MKYHDNSLKANEEECVDCRVHQHEILEFVGGLKNLSR